MLRRLSLRSFTLIELLVVMSIIAILAALILGASKYVQDRAAASRAQAEVASYETGLERYKVEFGAYPGLPTDPPPDSTVTGTAMAATTAFDHYYPWARLLFQSLTGKPSKTNDAATGPVYVEYRRGTAAQNGANSPAYFVDPWNQPYGYRTNAPNDTAGYNSGLYDLWSAGPVKTNKARWINNWSN
jgi:prepilin-type N-terminal cleavage/methylation domain-containing protein